MLEKLKAGEPLTAKDKTIHEHGLVSVLKSLHDELDRAVLGAYGWSDLAPLLEIANGNARPESAGQASRDEAMRALDAALLDRLVVLNAERAAEEARGLVRWLRPEFQNPQAAPRQQAIEVEGEAGVAALTPGPSAKGRGEKLPWPAALPEQVAAVARLLAESPAPLDADAVAARYTGRGPWKKRLPQLLETLVALGRARVVERWLFRCAVVVGGESRHDPQAVGTCGKAPAPARHSCGMVGGSTRTPARIEIDPEDPDLYTPCVRSRSAASRAACDLQ